MIQLEHVEVAYGRGRPVLAVKSLRIAHGEPVAVIGPSGASKSTLLRCLKSFVRPRTSQVEVLGVDLARAGQRARRAANRRVALIYQQFRLVPRLSALENTLCGRLGRTRRWRSLFGWFTPQDLRVAWAAIVEVGLAEHVHQRVDTLSGGEQQRVAVARSLAQEPELILADEPVSSLDPAWADEVLELLSNIQSRRHVTLVMSLHQPELARRFVRRVIGLRAGRIVWDGPARDLTDQVLQELYGSDRETFTAFRHDAAP